MKEIQPVDQVDHLPVRGDQIVGTAQGKTQRDSQLSGRMERATQWPPVHKPKIATSTSCQIQNSKGTDSKMLLLERSIRVSIGRNCNSATVFGSIKSYASCRTF